MEISNRLIETTMHFLAQQPAVNLFLALQQEIHATQSRQDAEVFADKEEKLADTPAKIDALN